MHRTENRPRQPKQPRSKRIANRRDNFNSGSDGYRSARRSWQTGLDLLTWERYDGLSSLSDQAKEDLQTIRTLSELKLDEIKRTGDINEYYHLLVATETLEESIVVPAIFDQPDSEDHGRLHNIYQLSDTYSNILNELVVDRDRAEHLMSRLSYDRRLIRELRQTKASYTGLVSELTLLAAISSLGDSNIAALQATAQEDLKQKIDAWVYVRDSDAATCTRLPVQTKTSIRSPKKGTQAVVVSMEQFDVENLSRSLAIHPQHRSTRDNAIIETQAHQLINFILSQHHAQSSINMSRR